jgi:predicted acetylornithine/succinylornithine family transaminase
MSNYDDLFVPTYARSGNPMVSGHGSYLVDSQGVEYLDFVSGIAVNALGYGNKDLENAISKQGNKLIHGSNLYFSDSQIDLANELINNSFGDKVFFCNSGTEANEAAFKFARKFASKKSPHKSAILSFFDGFHGRTYGALTATAQKRFHEGFHPLPAGYYYAPFNDIDATKVMLDAADFSAIIVEPIQGEGGVNVATKEFLQFLRDYSDENGILLIFDEIQCGVGRTGTLWAYEQFGVVPDIMTVAKPVGGGLPLGAVITTNKVAEVMAPGDHGTTFGGNPLAAALGTVVLKTVSQKQFLAEVSEKGNYLNQKLSAAISNKKDIESFLGVGLLCGVRFKYDPKDIVSKAFDRNLLLVKAGKNTVRFIPPLTVSKEEIDKAVEIFKEILG